jgi:hypothetical protein
VGQTVLPTGEVPPPCPLISRLKGGAYEQYTLPRYGCQLLRAAVLSVVVPRLNSEPTAQEHLGTE